MVNNANKTGYYYFWMERGFDGYWKRTDNDTFKYFESANRCLTNRGQRSRKFREAFIGWSLSYFRGAGSEILRFFQHLEMAAEWLWWEVGSKMEKVSRESWEHGNADFFLQHCTTTMTESELFLSAFTVAHLRPSLVQTLAPVSTWTRGKSGPCTIRAISGIEMTDSAQ
jgi:hypothetical protein